MLLRQVQADPLQGHHLRQVRRRGHAQQGPSRADGPHPAGQPGQPHLVLQGHAQPPRHPARHQPAQPRAHPVLRAVHRHPRRRGGAQARPGRDRGGGRGPRRQGRRASRRARGRAPRQGRQAAGRAERRSWPAPRPTSRRQRAVRTEEIAAAAQATEALLAALKTGVAEETIAFAPTGEVVVAAGDKGGKEATARLRKIVGEYTEQVNADLQQREADEARARRAEGRRPVQPASTTRSSTSATGLQEQAQGLKDELRKLRDELEGLKPMQTLGETEFRQLDERYGAGAKGGRVFGGRHGRRGRPRDHQPDGPRGAGPLAPRRGPHELRPAAQEGDQAAAPHRGLPPQRHAARTG